MPDLVHDLRYLKYALLVAEHGSFRRAADTINLSQSTVSRRIQHLERRLGAPLFERTRMGSNLTWAGERFIREAIVGAEYLSHAASSIGDIRGGLGGCVRIGVTCPIESGLVAEMLTEFRSRHPSVTVSLDEASSSSNTARVKSGRLDIAFVLGAHTAHPLQMRHLCDERVYFVLPSKHAFSERGGIDWFEMRDEVFLVHAGGAGQEYADYLARKFAALDCRPQMLTQRASREYLFGMVARGYGVAIATSSARGAAGQSVKFIPAGDGSEYIPLTAVWLESNQNPVMKKVLTICDNLSRRPKVA